MTALPASQFERPQSAAPVRGPGRVERPGRRIAPGVLFSPRRFAMQHLAGLRYPFTRVLLPRTRLAYVHLRNLLTDAKRDRSARGSGYVAVLLPEELVVLYLRRGELVNATHHDGHSFQPIAIGPAVEMVPAEPEYGEVTFCEAEEEQLACMYASQTAQQ